MDEALLLSDHADRTLGPQIDAIAHDCGVRLERIALGSLAGVTATAAAAPPPCDQPIHPNAVPAPAPSWREAWTILTASRALVRFTVYWCIPAVPKP